MEYSNYMHDIYKNSEAYNPNKKQKKWIVFDDMTIDVISNKKRYPIVTVLTMRGWKLNISVFIVQFYFAVILF